MKKGLILALLMVFAVALTVSVSANAPVVEEMKAILIGDADDAVDDSGVLMSLEIMDFMKVIDWNNDESITSDMYQVYLYEAVDSGIEAAVPGRGATVNPIDTADYNALVAGALAPVSSDPITQGGTNAFFWLSLIDTTNDPVDPYASGFSIDLDGHSISALGAYTNSATMKVIAGITSGTTQLVFDPAQSEADLSVFVEAGASDGTTRTYTSDASYDFSSDVQGWVNSDGAPVFPACDAVVNSGGIGFTITTPNPGGAFQNPTFGSWKSPVALSGSQAMAGQVYRVQATLVGDAADKDTAPGFRLVATNTGYSHSVKIISRTRGVIPAGGVNVPTLGNGAMTAKLYFAVPTGLGDMGDSEGQALFNDGAGLADFRKYRLAFDVFGDAADLGSLYMTALTVDHFGRPARGTFDISWGSWSVDTPFNAQPGGWTEATGVSQWTPGNFNITASTLALDCNATATGAGRYTPVASNSSLDTLLQPVSNQLYRFVAKVQTGDAEKTSIPTYRFTFNTSITVFNSSGLPTGVVTGIQYAEYFAYSNVKSAFGKQRFLLLPGQDVCPGAPANLIEDPSTIDCYLFSHNVAPQWTGSGSGYITTFSPLISLVDTMQFGDGTVWDDSVATIQISRAGWQDLGTDY